MLKGVALPEIMVLPVLTTLVLSVEVSWKTCVVLDAQKQVVRLHGALPVTVMVLDLDVKWTMGIIGLKVLLYVRCTFGDMLARMAGMH